VERIAGHQHAAQIKAAQQRARRGDLVLSRRDGNLAQHQRALAGKSADHMQGRGLGGTIK
jgi:hypothetical protein